MDMGQRGADNSGGLDEIDAVIVMLLNAGGHRKHIGIKDDVFRRKTDLGQQLVGALAD